MKTQTIDWTTIDKPGVVNKLRPARGLTRVLSLSANLFLALVPALAMIVGAAWLITSPDLAALLQVSLWGAGFVFLGIAVDADRAFRMASWATGLAMPVLALLSSQVAVEIALIAVVVLAAWTALAIWRRSCVERCASAALRK